METTIDEYARGYQAAKVNALEEIKLLKEDNAELIAALEKLYEFTPDADELSHDNEFIIAIMEAKRLISKHKTQ